MIEVLPKQLQKLQQHQTMWKKYCSNKLPIITPQITAFIYNKSKSIWIMCRQQKPVNHKWMGMEKKNLTQT